MHLNNKYIRLAFVGADTLTTGRMIPSGTCSPPTYRYLPSDSNNDVDT